MSFLDLIVKLLDVLLKMIGIFVGLQTVVKGRKSKKTRRDKKNHRH